MELGPFEKIAFGGQTPLVKLNSRTAKSVLAGTKNSDFARLLRRNRYGAPVRGTKTYIFNPSLRLVFTIFYTR
jgi:hypothetical protein